VGSSERNPNPVAISWTEELANASCYHGTHPPGEGWNTMGELKDGLGLGKEKLRKFLRELKAANRLESFTGSMYSETANGCFRQVWYRIHEEK
jgi:hypothetical protein